MALFSTISWCLWQTWNRLRKNQPTWPLKEVGERAIVLVWEFFDVCKSDARPSVLAAHVCWQGKELGFEHRGAKHEPKKFQVTWSIKKKSW